MGGHGGLNILPQKKWNVYNYDNRAIVEKDKKQAAAKRRAEYEKNRSGGLQGKIDVLLEEQGIQRTENKEEVEQKESLIVQQLRKMNEKNKHINLFEKEQKIIENREIQDVKRLQEAQFLKDKDTMDLSSKFLGTYADDKTKPWYAKYKGHQRPEKKPYFNRNYQKYEPKEVKRQQRREEQEEVQRSREKRERHQQKEEKGEKSQIEKMREKRLRREEKERQKIRKLKLLQGR